MFIRSGSILTNPKVLIKASTGFLQLVQIATALISLAIMLAGAASAQVCTAPPSGLVGWWPGDGNYKDIIGHNDGTPAGVGMFGPGEVGQAFSFNGASSVQVPPSSPTDPTDLTGDLTIETWIKPASNARGYIVLKGNGDDFTNAYALRYGDGNDQRLLLSVADGGAAASYFQTVPGAVQTGVFSHVAVVIQGTTATVYVNSRPVAGQYQHLAVRGSLPQPATQLTSNRFSDHGAFWIGNGPPGIAFNGLIDEVSVYNTVLSPKQIADIYNAGTAGKCKGCQVNVTQKFHQWDPPRPVPYPQSIPFPTVYPVINPTVLAQWNNTPQYFGFLPPVNPGFVLCATINSGCALTTAATALATFPIVQTSTPELLDIFLRQSGAYRSGQIGSTGPFEYCEFGPAWSAATQLDPFLGYFGQDPGAGQPLFDNDSGTSETIDQYLQNHVCIDQDRVILKLDENGSATHNHFILVTGQQINSNGVADWTVFDPGWPPSNTIPAENLDTLSGHLNGFFTNNGATSLGTFRSFQVSGARVFRDLTQPIFGGITISANSPVELLVTDPQGRRLGNINGAADIFEIPNSSYTRDFPLADDEGTGIAHGDPTGIKTAYVPSPVSGTYAVTVTGTALGTYTLSFGVVGTDNITQTVTLLGVAGIGSTTTYQTTYSSTPGSTPNVTLMATFTSTLTDISNSLVVGLIDNQGIANSLSEKIQNAQNASGPSRANILNAFQNEVNAQAGKHVTGAAVQVLLQDATSLLSQNQ